MLLNTAVHHPEGVPIPAPLRLAGARGVLAASTVATTAFLDTTLALAYAAARCRDVKDAYRAPYRIGRAAARRSAGSSPTSRWMPAHESFAELERIAAGVAELDVPALLLWGPKDPIFGDRYLDDLIDRLPHADVHRFEGAGHLVAEDRPYADAVLTWLGDNAARLDRRRHRSPRAAPSARRRRARRDRAVRRRSGAALDDAPRRRRRRDRRHDASRRASSGRRRRVSWRQLDDRVRRLAAGLARIGVRQGSASRCWSRPGPRSRRSSTPACASARSSSSPTPGSASAGLTRAVRGAWPDFVIGETRRTRRRARSRLARRAHLGRARLPEPSAALLGVSHSLGRCSWHSAPARPLPRRTGARRPRRDPVHLGLDRTRQGRRLHAPPALGAARRARGALRGDARHRARHRLRAVRAAGTRAGHPVGDAAIWMSRRRAPSPRAPSPPRCASPTRAIVFLSPAAILNVVATADDLTPERPRPRSRRVRTFLSTGRARSAQRSWSPPRELMPNADPAHARTA